MIKIESSRFYPNFIAESVLDISLPELKAAGITHLAFDIDETLVPKHGNLLSEQYVQYLKTLQGAGLVILIGSNTPRDLSALVRQIDAQLVSPSRTVFKPRKAYFKRIARAAGDSESHIAMVGDRLVNDIIGAKLAGLVTILVKPYSRTPGPIYKWYVKKALKHQKH